MTGFLFDRHNPEPELSPAAIGMARATAHADADHDGWGDEALAFLRDYAETHARFCGYEVTAAAESRWPDVSGKAWGSIFRRAAHERLIAKVGYAPDPHRNQNPAPIWASLIYRG